MAKHSIRRATRYDFADVMKIGDVYDGKDYLRYRYNSFIDDPNNKSYVYMVGHAVVGFSASFLVDGGQTLLFRSGRVKSSFQGQGIFGALKNYVRQQYRSTESLKYEVMAADNINLRERPTLKHSFTELSCKNVTYYASSLFQGATLPQSPSFPIVKDMTKVDIARLFSLPRSCRQLFPDGKLTVDWVPLRPMTANMKYIFQEDSLILSSGNGDDVSLLTFGTQIAATAGQMYHIDIHGCSINTLHHHVLRHLHHMMTFCQDDVLICVVSERELTPIIQDIMKTFSVHEHHCCCTKMYVFERDIGGVPR